jgi:hypothetical protein
MLIIPPNQIALTNADVMFNILTGKQQSLKHPNKDMDRQISLNNKLLEGTKSNNKETNFLELLTLLITLITKISQTSHINQISPIN